MNILHATFEKFKTYATKMNILHATLEIFFFNFELKQNLKVFSTQIIALDSTFELFRTFAKFIFVFSVQHFKRFKYLCTKK